MLLINPITLRGHDVNLRYSYSLGYATLGLGLRSLLVTFFINFN